MDSARLSSLRIRRTLENFPTIFGPFLSHYLPPQKPAFKVTPNTPQESRRIFFSICGAKERKRKKVNAGYRSLVEIYVQFDFPSFLRAVASSELDGGVQNLEDANAEIKGSGEVLIHFTRHHGKSSGYLQFGLIFVPNEKQEVSVFIIQIVKIGVGILVDFLPVLVLQYNGNFWTQLKFFSEDLNKTFKGWWFLVSDGNYFLGVIIENHIEVEWHRTALATACSSRLVENRTNKPKKKTTETKRPVLFKRTPRTQVRKESSSFLFVQKK
jgi:hypothetical protein